MRIFFALMLSLTTLASASANDDIVELVTACGRGRNQELARLFENVNERLVHRFERVLQLGGDDAADLAQEIWAQIHLGTIRIPENLTSDAHVMNWFTSIGRNILQARERKRFEINVVSSDPDGSDPMQQFASTDRSAVRWGELELLSDRLHRLLLLRVAEGKTVNQIAEEMRKSSSWVTKNLAEARDSLSAVLKGNPGIINPTVRNPELLAIVESKLLPMTRIRPVRMPDGALKIPEAEFRELLQWFSPRGKDIAWKYFAEGKHGGDVMEETGASQSTLLDVPKAVARAVARRYSRTSISVDNIWVVDANGVPLSPYRQLDRAGPPKDPVAIKGAAFWRAIEDWNLDAQQIMHMRFVERLTPIYIAFAMRRGKDGVTTTLNYGLTRLKQATQLPLTLANLKIVGDVSMMQIDPIKLPARPFLTSLEQMGDPSPAAKLRLATQLTSLPIRNLQCLVLMNEEGAPLASFQQRNWAYRPYSPVVQISRATLRKALEPLWEEHRRATNLYVNHRWSLSTIKYYLGLTQNSLGDFLAHGREALRETLGMPELSLTQLEVTEE